MTAPAQEIRFCTAPDGARVAGVCEVWILDLDAEGLEIYREPGDSGYRRKLERSGAESIAPAALSAAVLQVAAVFA